MRNWQILVVLLGVLVVEGFAILSLLYPAIFIIGIPTFFGTTLAGNLILLVIAILTATGGLSFLSSGFAGRI